MIKPKKIFEYFICFCNCFYEFLCVKSFSKQSILILLKNSFRGIFVSKNLPTKMRKPFTVFQNFYTESFVTPSQHFREKKRPAKHVLCMRGHFASSLPAK